MTVFDQIRDYFQNVADSLEAQMAASRVFPNAADAGTLREDIVLGFLKNHLPARCQVMKGGFVFDPNGAVSRQLDLMVTNDLTLQFRQSERHGGDGKTFTAIDGCYSVISVKSSLTKQSLTDALDGFASIPPMPSLAGKLSSNRLNRQYFQQLPYNVLFSFDGLKTQTLLNHLTSFYNSTDIPFSRRADLVIVLNKSLFRLAGEGGVTNTADGTRMPPGHVLAVDTSRYIGALGLISLLSSVQKAANLGSHLFMDFDAYRTQLNF